MGNKQATTYYCEETPDRQKDKWSTIIDNKQNHEIEQNCHLQLYQRKKNIFAKPLIASKNIMNHENQTNISKKEAFIINFQFFSLIENNHEEEELLCIPIISPTIKSAKIKKPLYAIIEIDPKNFIKTRSDPIKKQYTFLRKIGKGSYGVVFKAESLYRKGEFRAIKKIQKKNMDNKEKLSFINEFQILRKLDHPNIIKLYEIFQDKQYYYVVSELCEGGDLLDFINRHSMTQGGIKLIMTQILSAVKYMHNLQILHRDLKLENVVVVGDIDAKDKNQSLQIKIIDFGLSIDLQKISQTIANQAAGTLMYMAPQGLAGNLTVASDIWSCGIILYMLATKKIPYKYRTEQQVIQKIQKGYISRKYLHNINLNMKILINFMLEVDVKRRYTAEKALKCEWLKNSFDEPNLLSHSQKRKAAASLLSYNIKNNLVAMVESYLAFKKISQNQRQRLAKIFEEIDKERSGVIGIAQLKEFYAEYSQNYCQKEVEQLLKLIDKNKSGKIDFNEFISAIFNHRRLASVKNLEQVFGYLDDDNSGVISKRELKERLNGIEEEEIEHLFKELDKNKDNGISKREFVMYIQKQYER